MDGRTCVCLSVWLSPRTLSDLRDTDAAAAADDDEHGDDDCTRAWKPGQIASCLDHDQRKRGSDAG